MTTWMQQGMVDVVIKDALKNPSTLMENATLSISHDIDFGQFNLSTMQDISDDEKDRLSSWSALQPRLSVRYCTLHTAKLQQPFDAQ